MPRPKPARPPPPPRVEPEKPVPPPATENLDDVRWFFFDEKDGYSPFCSHDSNKLERAHAAYMRGDQSFSVVAVKGGHYDVDVPKRIATPTYWTDKPSPVTRGLWFEINSSKHTCSPCDEQVSAIIEEELKSSALWAKPKLINITPATGGYQDSMHKKFIPSLNRCIVWHDLHTVYNHTTSGAAGIFGERVPLVRGYRAARGGIVDAKAEMGELHCMCGDVVHLCLVVHGIGQAMEMSIHKSTAMLRAQFDAVVGAGRFGLPMKAGSRRLELLPIQWRANLLLDDGTINAITPPGIGKIRSAINETILDVLYFQSPVYSQHIIDSLTAELNRVYALFIARHPSFWDQGGRVSVLGHSLGGVISFDVLSHQELLVSSVSPRDREIAMLEARLAALKSGGPQPPTSPGPVYSKINFPVDNLFCLGSPLGVFLALRGARAHAEPPEIFQHIRFRLFNVFHPMDAVAYRLEPLLHYIPQEPAKLPVFKEKLMARAAGLMGAIGLHSLVGALVTPVEAEADTSSRIDWVMDNDSGAWQQYIEAVSAHTSYWTSVDLALFILTRLGVR